MVVEWRGVEHCAVSGRVQRCTLRSLCPVDSRQRNHYYCTAYQLNASAPRHRRAPRSMRRCYLIVSPAGRHAFRISCTSTARARARARRADRAVSYMPVTFTRLLPMSYGYVMSYESILFAPLLCSIITYLRSEQTEGKKESLCFSEDNITGKFIFLSGCRREQNVREDEAAT